jgi:hypothetical protein
VGWCGGRPSPAAGIRKRIPNRRPAGRDVGGGTGWGTGWGEEQDWDKDKEQDGLAGRRMPWANGSVLPPRCRDRHEDGDRRERLAPRDGPHAPTAQYSIAGGQPRTGCQGHCPPPHAHWPVRGAAPGIGTKNRVSAARGALAPRSIPFRFFSPGVPRRCVRAGRVRPAAPPPAYRLS